jgi:antitoxin ParD1/3/4
MESQHREGLIAMATIKITIPEKMQKYVEERLTEAAYNNASEYFRDLIREDQKRRAEARLEDMLLSGMESAAIEWTKEDIERMKNAARERSAKKREGA